MEFWKNAASNLVGGVGAVAVTALVAWLVRILRKQPKSPTYGPESEQITTNKGVIFKPRRTKALVAGSILFCFLGAIVPWMLLLDLVGDVPQWPFNRPIRAWAVTLVFGLPYWLFVSHVLTWTIVQITDPRQLRRPLTRRLYKRTVWGVGVLVWALLLGSELTPSNSEHEREWGIRPALKPVPEWYKEWQAKRLRSR